MNRSRRTYLLRIAMALGMPGVPFRECLAQDVPKRVIKVQIEGRKVITPDGAIRVTEGEVVELRWTCDEAVSLHIHGYDIEVRIGPGAPATTVIDARATGRFPIISHSWGNGGAGHETLTYLEIYPR